MTAMFVIKFAGRKYQKGFTEKKLLELGLE